MAAVAGGDNVAAPNSGDELGALSWLWNLGAFIISAVLGAIGGWAAFIGSTRSRLDSLEQADVRMEASAKADRDAWRDEVRELRREIRDDHAQVMSALGVTSKRPQY